MKNLLKEDAKVLNELNAMEYRKDSLCFHKAECLEAVLKLRELVLNGDTESDDFTDYLETLHFAMLKDDCFGTTHEMRLHHYNEAFNSLRKTHELMNLLLSDVLLFLNAHS